MGVKHNCAWRITLYRCIYTSATVAALGRDNMQFRKTANRNNIRDRDDEDDDDDDDDDNNNNNIITITGLAKISNDRDVRTRSKRRTRTRHNILTTRREAYNVQYYIYIYIFYISLFRILRINIYIKRRVYLCSQARENRNDYRIYHIIMYCRRDFNCPLWPGTYIYIYACCRILYIILQRVIIIL